MDQTASTAQGQGTEHPSAAIAAARRAEARRATPYDEALPPWNHGAPPTEDGTTGERPGSSRLALLLFLAIGMMLGVGGGVALLTIGSDDTPSETTLGSSTDAVGADPGLDEEAVAGDGDAADTDAVAASATTTPVAPSAPSTSAPPTTAAPDADDADTTENDAPGTATSCRFNLIAQSVDQAAVECDGGTVTLSGDTGRWHNDIATVFLSDGTTGTIYFEPRADGTFDGQAVVELAGGTNQLNRADAAFGVSLLLVNFTADGQHLHLNGDGRSELTATFTAG